MGIKVVTINTDAASQACERHKKREDIRKYPELCLLFDRIHAGPVDIVDSMVTDETECGIADVAVVSADGTDAVVVVVPVEASEALGGGVADGAAGSAGWAGWGGEVVAEVAGGADVGA